MVRELKPYIGRIAAFVALVIAIDWALYEGLTAAFVRGMNSSRSGVAVNRVRNAAAEVVVMGNSRAARQYDSEILAAVLDASVYNAGQVGHSLPYMRGLVDLLLASYRPRLFILNVDPMMIVDMAEYDRVAALAPFIDESPVVRELIYRRGLLEPVKYWVRSFRYNSIVWQTLRNVFRRDSTSHGYYPYHDRPGLVELRDVWWPKSTARLMGRLEAGPDPLNVKLLRDMLRASRAAGTRVAIVSSPRWKPEGASEPGWDRLLDDLDGIAREEDVPFRAITLDNTPIFRDADLFADPVHLNVEGAELFTKMVAEWLASRRVLALPASEVGYTPPADSRGARPGEPRSAPSGATR